MKTLQDTRILKARSIAQEQSCTNVRSFQIPCLSFQATNYYDIINWQRTNLTEPPCTAHIPEEEIQSLIEIGDPIESELLNIPCHTQAVERSIKVVTEASSKVCGQMNRDAFETKKQFK